MTKVAPRSKRSESPLCQNGAVPDLDHTSRQRILAERMLCRVALNGCQKGGTPCTDPKIRLQLRSSAQLLVKENPDVNLAPSTGAPESTAEAMKKVEELVAVYAAQITEVNHPSQIDQMP